MLSIVIPVFNEAESLPELHRQLSEVAESNGYQMEMVFVDDGSTDDSWQVIGGLAATDERVRAIRFRRNFGKAAALRAGFQAARGRFVMTLDADLQDDPHEIPRFLEAMEKPLDVVSGWKKRRRDPWHKVIPSRIFNWMVSRLTGVRLHDHNCGMKCYRREVLDEVRLYGELHRFVPVLAAARGFSVGEVEVHHRPRTYGRSKYGVTRFVKGFLDLLTVTFLTGFGQRPQHVLGTVGLVSFLLGALGLGYLAGYWLVAQWVPDLHLTPLHQRPLVIYCVGLLLLGGQLISMGLLAELMIAHQPSDQPPYSVAERIEPGQTAPSTTDKPAGNQT